MLAFTPLTVFGRCIPTRCRNKSYYHSSCSVTWGFGDRLSLTEVVSFHSSEGPINFMVYLMSLLFLWHWFLAMVGVKSRLDIFLYCLEVLYGQQWTWAYYSLIGFVWTVWLGWVSLDFRIIPKSLNSKYSILLYVWNLSNAGCILVGRIGCRDHLWSLLDLRYLTQLGPGLGHVKVHPFSSF